MSFGCGRPRSVRRLAICRVLADDCCHVKARMNRTNRLREIPPCPTKASSLRPSLINKIYVLPRSYGLKSYTRIRKISRVAGAACMAVPAGVVRPVCIPRRSWTYPSLSNSLTAAPPATLVLFSFLQKTSPRSRLDCLNFIQDFTSGGCKQEPGDPSPSPSLPFSSPPLPSLRSRPLKFSNGSGGAL